MLVLGVIIEYTANSLNRPFSYVYSGPLHITPGIRVMVPFNGRKIVGYVISVNKTNLTKEKLEEEQGFKLLEIERVIDYSPILNDELFHLAYDISKYYSQIN